jgi:hypothetical protein
MSSEMKSQKLLKDMFQWGTQLSKVKELRERIVNSAEYVTNGKFANTWQGTENRLDMSYQ